MYCEAGYLPFFRGIGMFDRIKRRYRDWRAAVAVRDEETRKKRIRRGLTTWRNQLKTGRCNKCGAGIVIAIGASSDGGDIVCCENQYLNNAPFTLNGTGTCVNVASVNLLNDGADSIGEPAIEASGRVRMIVARNLNHV